MSLYYEVDARKPTGERNRDWFLYERRSTAVPDVVEVPGTDALAARAWTFDANSHEDASFLRDDSLRPDLLLEAVDPGPETEPEFDPVPKRWRAHYRHLLDLLARRDPESLLILDLLLDGVSQVEIAARIGVSQPSVSTRFAVLRKWLGYAALPLLSVKRLEEALDVVCHGGPGRGVPLSEAEREVVRMVVHEHVSQNDAARTLGRSQGWVRNNLMRARNQLRRREGFGDVVVVLAAACRQGWSPVHLRVRESRRARRPGPIVKFERVEERMDPAAAALITELDHVAALHTWEIALVRYLDGQVVEPELGIDLAAKRRDVERLVTWRASKRCAANGWPLEELISDVMERLATRNLGRGPYDPRKGKFSHYVTFVIDQAVAQRWRKENSPSRIPRSRTTSIVVDGPCGEFEVMGLGVDAEIEAWIDAKRMLEAVGDETVALAAGSPGSRYEGRLTPEERAAKKVTRARLVGWRT